MIILAYYGDVATAAAVFAANPALADDTEAFAHAAEEGQESFVRLMLRYQPRLAEAGRSRRQDSRAERTSLQARHESERARLAGGDATAPLRAEGRRREGRRVHRPRGRLDARDDDICSTPLGWAAKFGKKEMVELLLDRGARPNLPDDPPWATPLEWARRRGHDQIVELLER